MKLKNQALDGEPLEVTFLPEKGMTFTSYKKGAIEAIDQSTWPLFEERYAGLGPLIGPHFHHRNPQLISPVPDESLFPHIANVKAQGGKEPFSHGIGRYAPWTVDAVSETKIEASLRGTDTWHGIPLQALEGQDFTMRYTAELTPEGLRIDLSIVSDSDSVVGLHTYYALANGKGRVIAKVQDTYNDQGVMKPIPSTWNYGEDHTLHYDLVENTDFGFRPFPDVLEGSILLETETHRLRVSYSSANEENQWQLWHPKGVSFVCIEPLSAKDPRTPHLSVSGVKILISIS